MTGAVLVTSTFFSLPLHLQLRLLQLGSRVGWTSGTTGGTGGGTGGGAALALVCISFCLVHLCYQWHTIHPAHRHVSVKGSL